MSEQNKGRSPLKKRIIRQLIDEKAKYIVIFLLLVLTIGFVSGFLVADNSILAAYNGSFEKYNVEDGNFVLKKKANPAQLAAIESFGEKDDEDAGIKVYENFYVNLEEENGSTVRVFKNREYVDIACLMEGEMPDAAYEIAIDRMYARNNGFSVGSSIILNNEKWTICGLVALSDYSALFENNSDMMFDSVSFGTAVCADESFEAFSTDQLVFCYSWKYTASPADEAQEKEWSDDLTEHLNSEVSLSSFTPRYLNQAITFTGDDMGSDKAMMVILLYIVTAILAFVFAVTISDTIRKEAKVIGTLRASGYTKRELIKHYMSLPVLTTLSGALVGNILGYTLFKEFCVELYYNSYSLSTYETLWSAEAFVETTVVPIAIMAVITCLSLSKAMRLSPLRFLREELSESRDKKTVPLSRHLPFIARFRLRVIFQNVSSYAVLFTGIIFANLLLMFGLGLPAVLDHYQESLTDGMFCSYQYILNMPLELTNDEHKLESAISMLLFYNDVTTENEDAEKFGAYTLLSDDDEIPSESVTLYGIETDSRYIDLDTNEEKVYVSSLYADKYRLEEGDMIFLKKEYEDEKYCFEISGIYDYLGGISVFMSRSYLNRLFDMDENTFGGYFSDSEITDIDEKYISTVIDIDALSKVSRQLDVSMGDFMYMIDAFAVIIFLVLMYILIKMTIEKNIRSISMIKILGYRDNEIGRLYLAPTGIVTVIILIGSIPIAYFVLQWVFRMILVQMLSGWLPLYIPNIVYAEMAVLGVLTYIVVQFIVMRRIQKIPKGEALKGME